MKAACSLPLWVCHEHILVPYSSSHFIQKLQSSITILHSSSYQLRTNIIPRHTELQMGAKWHLRHLRQVHRRTSDHSACWRRSCILQERRQAHGDDAGDCGDCAGSGCQEWFVLALCLNAWFCMLLWSGFCLCCVGWA
jgi:hypothetical protein